MYCLFKEDRCQRTVVSPIKYSGLKLSSVSTSHKLYISRRILANN